MFIYLIITAFAQQSEFGEAFAELSKSDPGRDKLNWNTLTQAMNSLLCDVQNAKQIEEDNQKQKSALYQRLISLHERTANTIKVDLAKSNSKLNDQLTPYKAELDEALKYRAGILEQQKSDLNINDKDYSDMKESSKNEINEVGIAIQMIEEMRTKVKENLNGGNSFIEMKTSIQEFHAQINKISKQDSPFFTLAQSLSEFLQLDFKERKVLKDLQALLDQFWMITIDYRIELYAQANRNQQLYEERRQVVLQDKETTIELYNSKIEQYNEVVEDIDNIKSYIETRQKDLDLSSAEVDFFKGIWGLNEGIANQVKTQLITKAAAIQEALQNVGTGVQFTE
ncbi:hypothetical protein pb186bvf_014602 [Paramecium bursaria]